MSEFIAEAQVLVVPNVTQFAATLKAQVEAAVAATGPVVIPVTAAPVAKGTTAANTQRAAAAAAIETETVALGANAAALERAGAAAQVNAVSQLGTAKAHEQATRAIEAQAASLVGVRGAVLTASTPFLLATAAVITFAKSLREASDTAEELNKTTVIFGRSAQEIKDFAETTASSLGISEVEALRAAGIFGNLFRSIEIGQRPAAQMSERLVRLASDLASFNNADPSRVLEALRSGLVGQARPLRVFGIFLSQARAQQEALIETGKKNVKALTNEELVRARFNIILKDSLLAQGDFARTSDRLANQTRILTANLSNLGAQVGTVLVPGVTLAVGAMNDLLEGIDSTTKAAGSLGRELGHLSDIGPIRIPVEIVRKGLGVGDQGPGGPPDLVESLKKAVVPALLIARGLSVVAAPETGGLSLLAGAAATLAGGLIATKQATDAYNKAALQATMQSQKFAIGLRGVGVDTKAAETPLLSAVADVQKLVQSLSVQAFPAEGLKSLLPHLQAIIATLQTGPPLAQAFANKLQGIELKLQLAANLSPAELRKALAEAQRELETFFKGNPLNVTADVIVKTRVSLDTRTAAAAFAGPAAELAQAQANRAEGLNALRALLGLGPNASRAEIQLAIDAGKFSKGRQDAINRALDEVTAADAVITAAANKAAADKKRAAAAAKRAAQEAARAQQEQTQAFIELFAPRQQQLQNRLTTAQLFGTINQQIAANRAIIAADNAEIRAIQAFIRRKHLHGDALKAAQAEIARIVQEEFNTRNAIIQLQQRRKQAIIDARQSHLEAQLAIAETTKTKQDDIVRLQALIAFDKAQIRRLIALKRAGKATRDEIALLDQYRVDLAQRTQALRDLQKTKQDDNAAATAFFSFLQTQAGFAANLLGNLIPGSATAGLVGGTTATGGFGQPGGPQPGGGVIPGMDVSGGAAATAAVSASRDRGVRPVQVDTTNQLLRHILRVLQQQTGRMGHPEARYQKATGSAIMDTEHGHG